MLYFNSREFELNFLGIPPDSFVEIPQLKEKEGKCPDIYDVYLNIF